MKIIYLTNPSIGRVDAKTLKGAIREVVDRTSRIMTDEWPSYTGIGKEYDGGHSVIRHTARLMNAKGNMLICQGAITAQGLPTA